MFTNTVKLCANHCVRNHTWKLFVGKVLNVPDKRKESYYC